MHIKIHIKFFSVSPVKVVFERVQAIVKNTLTSMQFMAAVGGTNINLASVVLKLFFYDDSFSNDLEGIDSLNIRIEI